MNVLIVCQYFYPEEFKVNELAEQLFLRDHNITVLTGKPTYPKGTYPKGYRFWGVQEEFYKGIKVIRVPELTRLNGGCMGVIQSMISFLISSTWYAKRNDITADVIICFQLSPITMANAALIYKNRHKSKLIHWVQDLWPESVSATTPIKKGPLIKLIDHYAKYVYKKSDFILIQSIAFKESICQKGDFEDKIIFAPNWADSVFCNNRLSIAHCEVLSKFQNDFTVMFAGNIGEAQDFQNIINAASVLKNQKHIKFLIVGDGRYKSAAVDQVKKRELSETFIFLGRHPVADMPTFFNIAKVMLVTLKNDYIFSLTIPSKTQAYMASGKPILTMLDGEGSRVVEEAQCGLTAHSGDFQQLAENVLKMSKMSIEELNDLGEKAKAFYDSNFSIKTVIDTIESLF